MVKLNVKVKLGLKRKPLIKEAYIGTSSITYYHGVYYMKINAQNHYDAGLIQGKLLKKVKHPALRLTKKILHRIPLTFLYLYVKKHLKGLSIPKEHIEELKGMAKGAGVSYRLLYLSNFIYDIFKKLGFHCSTFSFFNGDSLLVGRNTDIKPTWTRGSLKYAKSLVIKMSIKGYNTYHHVSVPFFSGVINGFNEHGIVVNSHRVAYCHEDTFESGLASSTYMRQILEGTKNMAQVRKYIANNFPVRSVTLQVTSEKEKQISVFERNPFDYEEIKSKSNKLWCTTHFKTKKMSKYHYGSIKGSLLRQKTFEDFFKGRRTLSIQDSIFLLQDQSNGLKHLETGSSIANRGTVQSFILDVTNKKIIISNGSKAPVSRSGKFVEIDL